MMIKQRTPGEMIKEIRLERGLTQTDVAAAVGVTKATISKYENGSRQITVKRFEEVLQALDAFYTVLY